MLTQITRGIQRAQRRIRLHCFPKFWIKTQVVGLTKKDLCHIKTLREFFRTFPVWQIQFSAHACQYDPCKHPSKNRIRCLKTARRSSAQFFDPFPMSRTKLQRENEVEFLKLFVS